MDQEQHYVNFFYNRYKGRVAIGVGYNPNFSEIYPLAFQATDGTVLGIVALGVIPHGTSQAVHIYHIGSFLTGLGNGTIMLQELCRRADEFQIILSVSALGMPNGNEPRISDTSLKHWYQTFKFKGSPQLFRQPTKAALPIL